MELARSQKWTIAAAVSCLCVSSTITMSVPFGLGKILDLIYTSSEESTLAKEKLYSFCLILSGVFLLGGLANFARVYLFSNACKLIPIQKAPCVLKFNFKFQR